MLTAFFEQIHLPKASNKIEELLEASRRNDSGAQLEANDGASGLQGVEARHQRLEEREPGEGRRLVAEHGF